MDTTIRNIDPRSYRQLKARAALAGKTVGEVINEAIVAWLARPALPMGGGSLRDLVPEAYPAGNERLSEQLDTIVYGPT